MEPDMVDKAGEMTAVQDRPNLLSSVYTRLVKRYRASVGDLSLVFAVILTVIFAGFEFDIFENEAAIDPKAFALELDEVLLAAVTFAVGILFFFVRLHLNQRKEIARRIAAEKEVRKLAYQDTLTGLANRRMFEERLRQALESPPKAGACHAVLLLDLNGFKQINDTYGHDAGDEVLVSVAQRLLTVTNRDDLVARLGGDEFIVLAQHLMGPEDASNIALRIIHALEQPIVCGATKHTVGTGIGIALMPMSADNETEVIRKADIALYRAKSEGRSAFRFFDEAMDQFIKERDTLESDLRDAIANGQVMPAFSPSFDLASNAVTGYEVTPQWIRGQQEIAPQHFLPIAEETGLIHGLARTLLADACCTAREWPENIHLSMGIFPRQLKDQTLTDAIVEIVKKSGLSPNRLEISIAENLIVNDLETCKRVFQTLHEAGIRTAIDNFGTGYSSIYHMRELKLNTVKIDQRLADGVDNPEGEKVFRALAGLGRGLGLAVYVGKVPDGGYSN